MSSGTPTAATITDTLWDAAERLRIVRRAHERFLALWAVDRLLAAPAATSRAWADLDGLFSTDDTPDNHAIPGGRQRHLVRDGRLDD